MRLTVSLLAATLILAVAPTALADSFQFTINSSVTESINNTDNDNIMGIYWTGSDSWGTQESVGTGAAAYSNSPFSNIAFSVPSGNTITSITMNLILPSSFVQGTADVFLSTGGRLPLHPPNPDNPVSIAPTLGQGTSSVSIDGILLNGASRNSYIDGNFQVFDVSSLLLISNNTVSTLDLDDVRLVVLGEFFAHITSPGYNYAAYAVGSGQANIPYELEVTGTYSPVPEPSSIALVGTGILGLAGMARRKFLYQP